MIKLKLSQFKTLEITKTEKIYKGENRISGFNIQLNAPGFGSQSVSDCDFALHAVLPDQSYIEYPIVWQENSDPYSCVIPITTDITAKAQFIKLFVEAKKGDTVVGRTNKVELQIFDSIAEEDNIPSRVYFETEIENLESEIAEQEATISEKTATIESLQTSVSQKQGVIDGYVTLLGEIKDAIEDKGVDIAEGSSYSLYPSFISSILGLDIAKSLINRSITSIEIPNDITVIGWYAFDNCSSLTSVTIPNSVTRIEGYAFENCSGLQSIVIPNSVTYMGNNAFAYCTSARSISVPNSLTSMQNTAFFYCRNVVDVTVENGFNCNGLSFSSCTQLTAEKIVPCLNALYDRTGMSSYTFSVGSTNLAKLTDEQKAIATSKNWNLT